jgi:hypothetical protein
MESKESMNPRRFKVGDLVQFGCWNQDIGIIIETEQGVDERTPKHKVIWLDGNHDANWMRPTELEAINASR